MVSKDQRRRQLARQKFERQRQRRAETRRKAKRRNVIIASAVAVALAAGAAAYAGIGLAGGGDGDERTDARKVTDPCGKPAPGSPSKKTWKKEPAMAVDTKASYSATLSTTCGTIGLKLDAAKAPRTVNSFAFLADQGYFDHSRCHRLVDQGIHVLQCGDPTATGSGTPGYTIPDENLKDPRLKGNVYPAGTVAMANRYDGSDDKTRDTGGSQFFLVFEDSELPPNYTPFGTITSGMDVLRKIADAGAAPPDPRTRNTPPNATVVIDKAAVKKS